MVWIQYKYWERKKRIRLVETNKKKLTDEKYNPQSWKFDWFEYF